MMHDRKPRDFVDMDGRCSEASKAKEREKKEREKKKKTVRLANGAIENAEELGSSSGPAELFDALEDPLATRKP